MKDSLEILSSLIFINLWLTHIDWLLTVKPMMCFFQSPVAALIFFMMTSSKGKHFPRYWPFVRGIHRSPVKSPHKGQWRGALVFSLICAWINGSVNTREAGDLRRHRAHYDVIVMDKTNYWASIWQWYVLKLSLLCSCRCIGTSWRQAISIYI